MVFIPLLIWIHKLVTSYVILHTGQFLYPRRRNHFQNGGNDSGPSWFLASMQRIKEREISNEILKKRNPKLGVTLISFFHGRLHGFFISNWSTCRSIQLHLSLHFFILSNIGKEISALKYICILLWRQVFHFTLIKLVSKSVISHFHADKESRFCYATSLLLCIINIFIY